MKCTAIILCRENSARLKKKHFKKIGKLTILEIIIKNLKKLGYVNKIVIATGSKKKNANYEKFIKQKKIRNVNIFYYDKEENVTERILFAAKKFKNTYTLLISGDCILLDKEFIDYYIKKTLYYKKFDFVHFVEKNFFYLGYEGIKFFRTNIWKKVNQFSTTAILQENPGYVVSKYPKKFKIKNIIANKRFYLKTKIRLSIDTQSDLDFFRLVYIRIKSQDITISSIRKNIFLKKINEHVLQKIPEQSHNSKILLITIKSKKFGLGHYKRTLVLKREISEMHSTNLKFINLEKFNLKKLKLIKNSNLILDLPYEILKKLENIIDINSNKVILIDQPKSNFRKKLVIVPSLYVEPRYSKNIFYGLDYLIINRNILYNFYKSNNSQKLKKKNLILYGGSVTPKLNIIKEVQKKIGLDCDLHLGPYTKFDRDLFNIKKLKIIKKTRDISELFFKYENIITRFGVTVYELLSIFKSPYVILHNEKNKTRIKTISYLYKRKYINILGMRKINNKKIQINSGCQKTVKLIINFFQD